jgi:hypothetical protein
MEEEELIRSAQAVSLVLRVLAVALVVAFCMWLWRRLAQR